MAAKGFFEVVAAVGGMVNGDSCSRELVGGRMCMVRLASHSAACKLAVDTPCLLTALPHALPSLLPLPRLPPPPAPLRPPQVTHDVSHLTCADFLRAPGVQTPLITRFSTVIHERGSPETLRDPRGFAVKFYTREGNLDLVGNNIPVGGWVGGQVCP